MSERADSGVVLPKGHTGSSLLHHVLKEAVAQYPAVFRGLDLPSSARAFKRDYGAVLARFEAARAASSDRAAIARLLVRQTQNTLEFASEGQRQPLGAYLAQRVPTPRLNRADLTEGAVGLPVEVPFEGRMLRGAEVTALVDRLSEARQLSDPARAALHWIVDYAAQHGGRIDLRDQRFVMLGAAAELAPTRLLLRAGANVLWIDRSDPVRAIPAVRELSGSVWSTDDGDDLLARPREIAAAIAAFAAEGPVHVGMYAYAAGESKEWRLGAAMHAIVDSLDPALVRSVSLLVSPTTVSVLTPDSVRAAEARAAAAPAWQKLLGRLRVIRKPGHVTHGNVAVARATVAVQGLSYQAAQYVGKIAAAEAYATAGTHLSGEAGAPITVSANVAGITRTRSLSHPLFDAAFAGASQFGVRIFDAPTTRALNGLLTLHDLLNPAAPGAATSAASDLRARAAALSTQQIHGGIYGLPWVLDQVIMVAAVLGLGQEPRLLLKRLSGVARGQAAERGLMLG